MSSEGTGVGLGITTCTVEITTYINHCLHKEDRDIICGMLFDIICGMLVDIKDFLLWKSKLLNEDFIIYAHSNGKNILCFYEF